MTLYYQGPGARITHAVFESLRPNRRTFAISELRLIHVAQDACGEAPTDTATLRFGSSALAGAGAVAFAVSWPVLHRPVVAAAALAIAVASVVVRSACVRGVPCPHELWAQYRGQMVCLYADPNRRQFEEVIRALKRVLEHRAEGAYG